MAFFSDEELACKCDRDDCDAKAVDLETRMKAEGLRRELNEALIVTSASRCLYWNDKVGGKEHSYHPKGMAIDFKVKSGEHMGRIVAAALKHGFIGFGIAKTFIHLDTRPGPVTFFTY